MPTTGITYPATVAQSSTGAVAGSNITRVTASDNSRATWVLTFEQTTETLYCTNFDFSSVPYGARITNISVGVEGNAVADPNNLAQNGCILRKSGANLGAAFTNMAYPTAAVETVDINTTTVAALGINLYGSDIKDSTFGVGLTYGCDSDDTLSIDSVYFDLTYTYGSQTRDLGRSRFTRSR